jgi:bifunctional non-homologous end joining protein LigD
VCGSRHGVALVTRHAPEVAGLAEAFQGQDAILDGELITLDDAGRPDFYAVLRRLTLSRESSIALGRRRSPLTLLAFDVLWLNGSSLIEQPYEQRRLHLESLNLSGPAWRTTPSYVEDPADILAVCTALGLRQDSRLALSPRRSQPLLGQAQEL